MRVVHGWLFLGIFSLGNLIIQVGEFGSSATMNQMGAEFFTMVFTAIALTAAFRND